MSPNSNWNYEKETDEYEESFVHLKSRCILNYPFKTMKHFMYLFNFLLQYLIPSIVILYFYGRIIYHIYLNLNIDNLPKSATGFGGNGGCVEEVSKSFNTTNNINDKPDLHHLTQHQHQQKKKNSNGSSGSYDSQGTSASQYKSSKKSFLKCLIFKTSSSSSSNSNRRNIIKMKNSKEAPHLLDSPHNNNINENPASIYSLECRTINLNEIQPAQQQQKRSFVQVRRKGSHMRVDGINRTGNLKKSIKVMVIIITLFLLSWLPIHLYRLTTTFYPLIADFYDNSINSSILHLFLNLILNLWFSF
jgi:hypothetical protein